MNRSGKCCYCDYVISTRDIRGFEKLMNLHLKLRHNKTNVERLSIGRVLDTKNKVMDKPPKQDIKRLQALKAGDISTPQLKCSLHELNKYLNNNEIL